MFEEIFLYKTPNESRLIQYGFERKNGNYSISKNIPDEGFSLDIVIADDGSIDTRLTDSESGDEYILYKTEAEGPYVGRIRECIEIVLNDVADKCFDSCVFKQEQTFRIIEQIKNKYGDSPEHLWKKFPDNAVFRRKDTKKWYGAILSVPKNRFGFDSDKKVEVIDLRTRPEEMEELLQDENYYPGWHMNKRHWYTVFLDGSVPDDELFERIVLSYDLAVK